MMNKEELLVIEPIIGYRIWSIVDKDNHYNFTDRLKCSYSILNYTWRKGVNRAECKYCDSIPGFNCCCGFYAFKNLNYLEEDNICIGGLENSVSFIFGEVELFGKIIEHEFGYRAEKANVRKLVKTKWFEKYLSNKENNLIKEIAYYYEVPLINYDEYIWEKELVK